MNTRLASVAAALALSLAAPAAALAQSAAAFDQPAVQAVRTSGSTDFLLGSRAAAGARFQTARGFDSSAKGGNSEHTNFSVPNFGTTAGGPAY